MDRARLLRSMLRMTTQFQRLTNKPLTPKRGSATTVGGGTSKIKDADGSANLENTNKITDEANGNNNECSGKKWIGKTPLSERLHPNQKNIKLDSQSGIEQFLDAEATAGARRTGRAWRISELRLKSFDDLHRLWFILLKERNVLLTERAWCKSNGRYWTNGNSNMAKVQVSMARLKTVVGERLRAAKLRRTASAPLRQENEEPDLPKTTGPNGISNTVQATSDQAQSQLHVATPLEVPIDKENVKQPLNAQSSQSPQMRT